jgi:hypothetical protein
VAFIVNAAIAIVVYDDAFYSIADYSLIVYE